MTERYIYSLRDPRTNKIRYIGYSKNVETRLKSHLGGRGKTRTARWIRSLKAMGLTPICEIVEICNQDNWQDRERYWIEKLRADGCDLVNTAPGGMGGDTRTGFKATDETKAKISRARKGVPSYWKGKHMPDVSKEKLSEYMKAKWQDPDARRRMSECNARRRYSDNAKKRLSESRKAMWARPGMKEKRSKKNEGALGRPGLSRDHVSKKNPLKGKESF